MSDLALGWAHAEAVPPDPMRLVGHGAVRLLTAPAHMADLPRQRLLLLQACFDAGMDLVPLSASQRIPADRANTCDEALAHLADLRACGQLSLTLTWRQAGRTTSAGSGQTWLQMRQQQRAKAAELEAAAAHALATLAARLPYRQAPLRMESGRITLDLLVPRNDCDRAKSDIGARGQALDCQSLPGASLLVTGLWPPFSFVTRPSDARVPT